MNASFSRKWILNFGWTRAHIDPQCCDADCTKVVEWELYEWENQMTGSREGTLSMRKFHPYYLVYPAPQHYRHTLTLRLWLMP